MSFSFGFNDDDISDEEVGNVLVQNSGSSHGISTEKPAEIPKSSPQTELLITPAKIHTLDEVLSTLKDVRITFDNIITAGGNVTYKREHFDIKHQVMLEDENEPVSQLLDSNTDLQKNVYEGGFKNWECSYDAVDDLFQKRPKYISGNILELGCGTALPSCQILIQRLQAVGSQEVPTKGLKLYLSDFNYDVLRLVTVPNLIIHWASTIEPSQLQQLTYHEEGPQLANDELVFTSRLIDAFKLSLDKANVQIVLISGSWGLQFVLLLQEPLDFIISSETIYSLDTLPLVAEMIQTFIKTGNSDCHALVAAKDIYFGVGGSVVEFVKHINAMGLRVDVEHMNAQLKRSLIRISAK